MSTLQKEEVGSVFHIKKRMHKTIARSYVFLYQKHTLHCTRQHFLLNEERKKKAVVRTVKPTQEKVFITSYYKQTSNLPLFTLFDSVIKMLLHRRRKQI